MSELKGIRSASGLTAEFVIIDPSMANKMLQRAEGKNFRKASLTHVNKMAEDMRSGRWRLDGSPVRMDEAGFVIDGQNRLKAVVASGTTLEFLVVRHVKDSSMVDGEHEERLLSQHLANLRCAHPQVASAVLRLAYRHSIGKLGNRDGTNVGGLANWLQFYRDNAAALNDSIEVAAGSSLIPKSIMGALHFVANNGGIGEKAIAFRNRVTKREDASGVLLDPEDPAAQLNGRLHVNRSSKAKIRSIDLYRIVIKAWNFWLQGVRIKRLMCASSGDRVEAFPEISVFCEWDDEQKKS